uniref:TPD52 like 2 n=1 Tax=Cebus imitator TaxID=2715852 RepID=A0A2K5REG3_CEBIM
MDSASQNINLNSPNKGLLSDSMTGVPVDTGVAAQIPAVEGLTEAEEELRSELTNMEEEIVTLRQVLAVKERHCRELRGGWNLSRNCHDVHISNTYKKTQETLSQAGQNTSATLSTVGSAIKTMRNSATFKSFEDRVGTIKSKVMVCGSRDQEFETSLTNMNCSDNLPSSAGNGDKPLLDPSTF